MKIIAPNSDVPVMSSCCQAAAMDQIHCDHHDNSSHQHEGPGLFSLEVKFIICLIFSLPLLSHMALPWHFLHDDKVQLLLSIPVFLIGLQHFGVSAYNSLRAGAPNMDVLIVLGSGAAFIYSLTGTILGLGKDYLFYETAASIFTIVLFGNLLEKLSAQKTSSAISELSKLQKITAKKITTVDGQEKVSEIDSGEIEAGNILLVNSGDKIPTDSEIIWGTALVDESMISGESLPLRHEVGAKVIGGTIVTEGNIKIRAESVGKDTVLSHIIALVKDAQSKKPVIQRLADRISLYFVPAVLGFAAMTFILAYLVFNFGFTAALLQSIAVLVIACPCALGLATPAAVMVGLGKAVKNGLLLREGRTLEKLAQVKTIIFDKTGTLTNGIFKITKLESFGMEEKDLKGLLYSLEMHSSHPLAKSIISELEGSTRIEFQKTNEEKGVGIHAIGIDGAKYSAGSYEIASSLTEDKTHTIYLVKDGKLAGFIDLEDEVKAESAALIKRLTELGIESVILSGDSLEKCKIIGEKTGINQIYARKTPKEKLEIVDEIQKKGPAAFVGDGINDAPALSKAAVGISLSSASQVAIQSAQVILVGGSIKQLAYAIEIGRKTLLTIKQNLFWAFAYNVIALPVAALGFLTPSLAAFAMSFSDVIIILNSLRLKTFKPSK
jgi:Cu+-exporting ATPase